MPHLSSALIPSAHGPRKKPFHSHPQREDDAVTIGEAVAQLIEDQGSLGGEGQVLAAQMQALAKHLDDGDIPAYATPAAHREMRALVEQMCGSSASAAGLTDRELDALLSGDLP